VRSVDEREDQGGVVIALKLRADLFLSVPPQYIIVPWRGYSVQYWIVNLGESRKTDQPVSDFGGRHLPLSSVSFASRENLLAICPPSYSPRLLFTHRLCEVRPGIEWREEVGIVSGDATRGCIRTSNNINDGVAWVVGSTAWTRKIGGEVGRGCLCR
ncbi:hypothetical protein ALC56_13488, partial [Trachymyrmex septentrionalis]